MRSIESGNIDRLADIGAIDLFRGLNETTLRSLIAELEWIALNGSEMLFRQGEPSDALFIVITGLLQVEATQENGSTLLLGQIGPGQPAGEMQVLAGGKRTASVYALCDSQLIRLPKASLEKLAQASPEALDQIAGTVRQRLRRGQLLSILPRFCGPLDDAALHDIETRIEWRQLQRGARLFRQGDACDSLYILISGRLQAVLEGPRQRVIGEVSPGETVGEVGMFTGNPRNASIYAVRDSVLVRLSKDAFERLMLRHPQILMQITRLVTERFGKLAGPQPVARTAANIALAPIGVGAPLTGFAQRLVAALSRYVSTLHLNSARLDQLLEMPGASQKTPDDPHNIRLGAWLDEQETQHHFVVYETDPSPSAWTQRCLRQADLVLLIAPADANPGPSQLEAILPGPAGRIASPRRMLVLLHPDNGRRPSGAGRWLAEYGVESHHHLRMDSDADFGRLARFLAGQAVGLVLGGGGARGFAHIGVIRALGEAGVPIDFIGGTSMGAVIAAQYAMAWNHETMLRMNRKAFIDTRPFRDYTLPLISLVAGRKLDAIARMAFGDTRIEDLWLNYFCVSSNLSSAEMVVHRQGLLWRAIRASTSIPGIVAPMLQDHELLADGALFDNLPGDVMRQLCGGTVIVVDVSTEQALTIGQRRVPSPWEMLWSRILPFSKPVDFPNILDVLMRTTLLGSERKARAVKQRADLCLQPPVDKFGLLEFDALDEIADLGYRYAVEQLAAWTGTKSIRSP